MSLTSDQVATSQSTTASPEEGRKKSGGGGAGGGGGGGGGGSSSTLGVNSNVTSPSKSFSKMSNRAGLNFLPGSKLEAKDFNEKWYSAKVVETDWSEREVLIHFEKWNSRYDEWIPMDSSRLRALLNNPRDARSKEFVVGERVLATWGDGKKYPAKINATLGNDKYDVLFDDGYTKVLRSSKVTKIIEAATLNRIDEQQQQQLLMQQHQQILLQQQLLSSSYVGSKQERRDKKRKHTVTELFHPKKRNRNEGEKGAKKLLDSHAGSPIVKSVVKIEHGPGLINTELSLGADIQQNILPIAKEEEDYATYIGDLRVEIEDSMYKCPKVGCNKNFRKENLLQMHIKHYHPEYSKFLGSTPNVADLAYARTIGESVEDVLPKKSRAPPVQVTQISYMSPSVSQAIDTDSSQTDVDTKLDSKIYSENNASLTEDNSSEQSNSCTMSPGTLFDMRYKEERIHTGIKTLPPVRHNAALDGSDHAQYLGLIDQKSLTPSDKPKPQRKRQHSESASKNRKQPKTVLEVEESFDPFDDSILDGGDDTVDSNFKCSSIGNSKSEIDNADSMQSQAENVIIIDGEAVKVEKLRREEIINCTCGITEEDGLMIQCDLCLCWQHGFCNNIEKEKDVPEKYVCYICQNAYRQRPSKKYFHDQDWIREGKLPTIKTSAIDKEKTNLKAAMLKRSYDLLDGLLKIQDVLHSLRVKVNIVKNKDHPKLYLWAKNWSKVEIPEFPTEPVEIMEVVKTEIPSEFIDGPFHDKLDLFPIKTESDQKSITSDTELMNILEDGTQIDKSKLNAKQTSPHKKNDGQILTNASTTNGVKEEDQTLQSIKQEVGFDSPTKQNSSLGINDIDKNDSSVSAFQAVDKLLNVTQQPIIPEPEAPIDPVDCKLRLLEHIEHYQNYVDSALTFVEAQLTALENANVSDKRDTSKDVRTKQTVQMILRDLETMRKLAALSLVN